MKNIFILLLFVCSFFGKAQSLEQLKLDAVQLYDATYTMDINYILSKTYPKLFDIISKEDMEREIDNAFQNEIMRIRLVFPKTTYTYSDIKTINGKKFCVVTYKNVFRMIYEEKLNKEMADITLKMLQESLTNKKVTFENTRNSFYIEGNDTLVAIADDSTKNEWYFLNYDTSSRELFTQLFDKDILFQLGLH